MDPGYQDGAQPGLEVAPQQQQHQQQQQQPWLQVRTDDMKELVVPVDPEMYYRGMPPPQDSHTAPITLSHPPPSNRKKKLRIVVAIVIALVVVLAAVLGGVLGSRAGAGKSDASALPQGAPEPSKSPNPSISISTSISPTGTAQPQMVQQGSSLTVGGWRKPNGDLELWLFYQDRQDELRYSRCNSTRPLPGQKSCWGPPVSFNSYPKANAPLGLGLLIFGNLQPQAELFYGGQSNRLLGTSLNDQVIPSVSDDSVNGVQITTGTNSSLASYWPLIIFQDSAGSLWYVRNRLLSDWSPTSDWDVTKTKFTAMTASKLALVPMSTNFTRTAATVGSAIFYQAVDGKLAVGVAELNTSNPETPQSWTTDIPSITLPNRAPIAAFSVARPTDTQQRVDTYVLYPDLSYNLHMLYTDTSSGSTVWKTTQPAALGGVDKDTNLACLTFSTTDRNAVNSAINLETASEDIRCFYQKGGLIMEAKLVGTDWEVTGNVPIP
ncbi:hypothetical protein B0T14DRAFT_493953 [Immersiella caudata]|uniref:Fucose-specific lectin n=1 Tax=Immersiella caudata TaxID=314043 RepID=A0AA39X636_9PEZI|nr:hypothetical protein B0T14DRAFT_493953 [Immersiella caudata]